MIDGIVIEPFKGGYEELERMAHASWRDEYGEASFPNFYRPVFLHYLFDRIPADKRDHLVGAYKDGRCIAFLANLPQKFQFQERIYNAVYSCLLVTRKEHLRQGVALALIRAAVEGNRKYGYDFSLLTLESGHRSTKMMNRFRAEGCRIESIRKSGVMARILDLRRVAISENLKGYEKAAVRLIGGDRRPKATPGFELRDYRPGDLEACHALLDRYRQTVPLARVWDKEELAVELAWPEVARTLIWERDGRVRAMINVIVHEHLGRTVERWAWINHVAFGDLSPSERSAFLRTYLGVIKAEDMVGTVDFTRRGWPAGPFYRAGFFRYPRTVSLVSWTFNPDVTLAGVPIVYEIQA